MVRCYAFMTSTKKRGGVIIKFWIIFQMVVDGVFGGGIFLGLLTSTNPKSKYLPFHHKFFFKFFFTFNCYSASLKLILQLTCSSIMETQRVRQPFMKASLGNMCSFLCQFYYRLVNTVRFNEEKSYCISVLILLLMFLPKIPKHHFLKVLGGDYVSPLQHRGVVNIAWLLGGSELFTFLADFHK